MIRVLGILISGILLAACGGCATIGFSSGGYRLTAYFAKAPSLYKESRVKVMGLDAGTVTAVRAESGRVRVEIEVDRKVPLPVGVHASIASASTLGERSLVLYPAWKPGMGKAAPGTVIPQERTDLPVEIDDALGAFTKLSEAMDPDRLRQAIKSGAQGLDGKGADVNAALQATGTLTHDLAGQDQRIVALARGLRDLAATLNRKDARLGETIDSFAEATRLLAGERTRLQGFLTGIAALVRKGDVIVKAYQQTLPGTAAGLSEIVMTLKTNSGSLAQAINGLAKVADVVVASWDRQQHVFTFRAALNATVRAWLQPLFTRMGWGTVPCIPNKHLANCPAPGKAR